MGQNPPEVVTGKFTGYHWKLFILLSVATFFEGYDFIALTQVLPELREEFQLGKSHGAGIVAFINLGTVLAYLLVRKADVWGRRRVLMVTILGYTTFTVLTGLAPNAWTFSICQLMARIFLIGEWAISMVYAAEEFPAARRGLVIGVIQAFATLGSVVCAGVVPILLKTGPGWRTVYFIGAAPLLLLAFARRNIRETKRFESRSDQDKKPKPFGRILKSAYRGRMLKLAAIWALTYVCTHNAVVFWKEFAVAERAFTNEQVGLSIVVAAVAAMPLVFASGWLLDLIGRRWGATVIFILGCAGVLGSYTLYGQWPLTIALTFGIFGASAVLPVLNAYNTELFPTDLRGDAFAWANNLIGRIGYVASPLAVGLAAESIGWGPAVASTAIFPLIALGLIWLWLPETGGRELEETSAAS